MADVDQLEAAAFSPAESTASSMSTSSDASPVPSPDDGSSSSSSCYSVASDFSSDEYSNAKRPRLNYRDCLEARLQPTLTPARSLPSSAAARLPPAATHRADYDEQLQSRFRSAVDAASFAELDLLLRQHSESIDINRYDEEGQTPLQHFCSAGDLNLVKLLVQYGADLKMRTREGWSMLHIASFAGSSEMLSYVLKCSRR